MSGKPEQKIIKCEKIDGNVSDADVVICYGDIKGNISNCQYVVCIDSEISGIIIGCENVRGFPK